MAVTLVINSGNFSYPEQGDSNWGETATAAMVALTSSALQKSGGLFTLTEEADFGANFGLQALYYRSRTADVANSGQIRLAVSDTCGWRNNANTSNLTLAINASDQFAFNTGLTVNGNLSANGTTITLENLPTTSGALSSGDLWRDPATNQLMVTP